MSSPMSSLVNPGRIRAPRTASTAFERARLALVPSRRVQAPRAPFAILVFLLLGAGVVGLLMFNTHMQQASFYATRLQAQADSLAAQRQALEMELQQLRDPQHLAVAGRGLGMVKPPVSGFIKLDGSGGASLLAPGIPPTATSADGMPIYPRAPKVPALLRPKPFIVNVPATTKVGQTSTTNGHASTGTAKKADKKKAPTNPKGAGR